MVDTWHAWELGDEQYTIGKLSGGGEIVPIFWTKSLRRFRFNDGFSMKVQIS